VLPKTAPNHTHGSVRRANAAVVARVVRETHHRFDAHPTREFVPILVEDAASDTLRVMPTTIARRRR